MRSSKALLWVAVVPVAAVGYLLLFGWPGANRPGAAEFDRVIVPAVQRQVTAMLSDGGAIKWTSEVAEGYDEAAAPSLMFAPTRFGHVRLVRAGVLDNRARVVADAMFSRTERRFTSVAITITFPGKPDTGMKNVAITRAYLAENGIQNSLATALLKGVGKGSMESTQPLDYQASARMDGKTYEATTAIYTGPRSTALTLICRYVMLPSGDTAPFG